MYRWLEYLRVAHQNAVKYNLWLITKLGYMIQSTVQECSSGFSTSIKTNFAQTERYTKIKSPLFSDAHTTHSL